MIASILVVCEGNICRSPMGEIIFRTRLPGVQVWSAGIGALVGSPPAPHAREVMCEHGFDISSHRAQQLSEMDCKRAELILVMEHNQKRHLERRFPYTKGRVYQLGHFGKFDVPDPYRKARTHFEQCFELLDRGAADWVERIGSSRT
jgi:protein-tyrosine phosphatase